TITGGNQVNTLVGANVDSVWTLTGPNAGTITGTGLPPVTFALIQALTGGTQDDTLQAPAAASVWTLTGATAGTVNTLPFTGIEKVALTFPDTADAVRITQPAGGGIRVESAIVGGFVAATIAITGAAAPAIIVDTRGGDDTVVIDGIQVLVPAITITTGSGNDAVVALVPAALAPKLTIDGGPGIDRFEDYTGATAGTGGLATVTNVEIVPIGLPSYTEQGPGAITETTPLTADKFPAAAAVNGIAIQPGNPLVMFLASVNGGVWRTIDGGTTWKPLTDQLPSLSIGAIAIAAKDKDGNDVIGTTSLDKLVVFAGSGSFSSFSGRGGFPVGLFKSLDGGDTWSIVASDQLSQIKITSIVASDKDNVVVTGFGGEESTSAAFNFNATAAIVKAALEALPNIGVGNVDVTGGALPGSALTITFKGTLAKRDVPNLIPLWAFAGGANPAITVTTVDGVDGTTDEIQTLTITGTPTGGQWNVAFGDILGGVFRSTDGGATFSRRVAGMATDLVADPGQAGRLYAGVAGGGVYRSDDAGLTWKLFAAGLGLKGDQVDNDGHGFLKDPRETAAGALRIRLAVGQNPRPSFFDPNPVYAALIAQGLMGVFVATPIDTGATPADWTQSAWALLGPGGAVAPAPASASLNSHATTASVTFTATTITRTTGDWRTDGFAVGQAITISGATVLANNGSWRIASVTALVLTVTGSAFTGPANAVAFAATSTAVAVPGLTITAGLTTVGVLEWPPSNPKQQPQVNLGGQGNLHFGFVADGFGNVFISGDISLSTAGYPAGLFLFSGATNTWTQLVDQTTTAGIVRPHADVRALILDPAGAPGSVGANVGKLLLATDGGVWRLDLAATPKRLFTSLNGGGTNGAGALRISEVLSVAYDELNGMVFGGAQDNGSYEQFGTANDGLDSNANNLIDDLGERITWRSTSGGDGNSNVAIPVDTNGDGLYDRVLHIVGSNNLTYFTEKLYAADGTVVSAG
ncbi:MAG: hypothetical protein JWO56_1926, partial [Acidobacteria bacterium]|nr:hypothetical protein [Acidobacteriota bacterium]